MLYYDFFCVFFFSIFLSFFFFFNDTATTEIYTLSLHDALPIFRTAFASLTALFTALIIGPLVINRLREFQIDRKSTRLNSSHPSISYAVFCLKKKKKKKNKKTIKIKKNPL